MEVLISRLLTKLFEHWCWIIWLFALPVLMCRPACLGSERRMVLFNPDSYITILIVFLQSSTIQSWRPNQIELYHLLLEKWGYESNLSEKDSNHIGECRTTKSCSISYSRFFYKKNKKKSERERGGGGGTHLQYNYLWTQKMH